MSDRLNRNALQIDEGNTASLSFLFLFYFIFVFNYLFIYLFYIIIIIFFSYLLYDTRKEQDMKQKREQDKTQEKRLGMNQTWCKERTRQDKNKTMKKSK